MEDNEESVQAEPAESLQPSPEGERSEATKSDGWDEALEAFEDPTAEPKIEEEKKEGPPKSQLEQTDPLGLETLRIPHKYKGEVQKYVETLSTQHKQEVEARNEELGKARGASKELIDVLKEVAKNPMKLTEYVVNYGEQVGLDPQVVQQYRNLTSQDNSQSNQTQAQVPDGVEAIIDGYVQSLITTEDPQQFVGSLKSMIVDALTSNKSEMEATVKQWLTNYHEQIVNPDLETIREGKAKAEFTAKVSAWNEAKTNLSEKYDDFDKYAGAIQDKLKNDPKWARFRTALNKGEEGLTHEGVLEDLYNLLSRNDHIQALKPQKPKVSGLPPNSKHITTKKAGGNDWDEIQDEFWS